MGSTTIQQPTPPAQPTTADAINAWVNSMPQVYQTQMQYAPLEAAQQVALAQQYAPELGQAQYAAQAGLYPQTTALQEQLAGQASQGMQSPMPDWMKQQYQSDMNAQLGTNVNSPLGADYASRGLMQMGQNWQQYYQNLGLSVTGRQPLTQASTPGTSNYMGGYTPNSVMGYTSSTYSPYASAYSNMYNSNANYAMNNANLLQGYIGMGLQGAGAAAAF